MSRDPAAERLAALVHVTYEEALGLLQHVDSIDWNEVAVSPPTHCPTHDALLDENRDCFYAMPPWKACAP